jgi:hypothetical protein
MSTNVIRVIGKNRERFFRYRAGVCGGKKRGFRRLVSPRGYARAGDSYRPPADFSPATAMPVARR